MTTVAPRVVIVTRETAYQGLLKRSGSEKQAKFRRAAALRSSSPPLIATASAVADIELQAMNVSNRRYEGAQVNVSNAVPSGWRQAVVRRQELDRFPFEANDIVVVNGPDGLVANVSKYLRDGQPVIGLNPEPEVNPGVLVPHRPEDADELIHLTAEGHVDFEERTMVEAKLDDGETLTCLNEIFIGHRSHQSARYKIDWGGQEERQSSSGVVVSTGTGVTGWTSSILKMSGKTPLAMPAPTESRLAFFVREPWPSPGTGTEVVEGGLEGAERLLVTSELNDGGVIFGDGIEQDFLDFRFGMVASVGVSDRRLRLVK